MTTTSKITRDQLKPGEVLCSYCTAKCCGYFALQIDTPTSRTDFDSIRWYMLHGRVSIFVDDGDWYLMVHSVCDKLRDDYMCGIYEDRPQICRDYTTDNCEYEDNTCYEKFFETPEQLWEYALAVLPPEKTKKKRKDLALPVV